MNFNNILYNARKLYLRTLNFVCLLKTGTHTSQAKRGDESLVDNTISFSMDTIDDYITIVIYYVAALQ